MCLHATLALLLCVLNTLAFAAEAQPVQERTVVVILVDGFPASLLATANTKAFDRLKREGVWSDSLEPAFPSVSHANWATLSTGCWPERHGIVSNHFEIDGVATDFAKVTDADSLLDCEPIHVVAERNGVRSAALSMTGATSSSRGVLASRVAPYFEGWSAERDVVRAAQVVEQLDRSDSERPRLILAYFSGPDSAQHASGIDSFEARAAVEASDRALGMVFDRISTLSRDRAITLFVVTDHGMVMVNEMLNVASLMRSAGVAGHHISDGPIAFLYLDDPRQKQAALERLAGDARVDVVDPNNPPKHWRLGSTSRVGEVILYTRPPYFFPMDRDLPSWLPPYGSFWPLGTRVPEYVRKIGMHGYAFEDVPEMLGIFFAWGSGIAAPRQVTTPIRAVDLHPTVAKLLRIPTGQPVDGQVLYDVLDASAKSNEVEVLRSR